MMKEIKFHLYILEALGTFSFFLVSLAEKKKRKMKEVWEAR